MASGVVVGEERGDGDARQFRLAAARGRDAEFQIVDEVAAQGLVEVLEDVAREGEELLLPGVVFDFDDEACADQFGGARVPGGDLFCRRLRATPRKRLVVRA